jgi:hypothetical protein
MSLIVDAHEPPAPVGRGRSLALAPVAVVLLVFAATLEPVQQTARSALGLAGIAPLAVTMSGEVTDEEGAPIAHAFVRVSQDRELATGFTDQTGTYRLAFSIQTREPANVSVGATGYEASVRGLHVSSTDPRSDARLRRRIRIDSGSTAHLAVGSGDGLCSLVRAEGDHFWPCRLVHVTVAAAGVLNVAVEANDPRDRFGVAFAVGSQPTLVFATPCCPFEDAARLPQGADALVQIVALDLKRSAAPSTNDQHFFTLRTALGPP